MNLNLEDLQRLYGDRFFLVPGDDTYHPFVVPAKGSTPIQSSTTTEEVLRPTGKLIWRPKPRSKVLFIIHQSELKDKVLTDLLKKIVESIEIPFDSAGFGIITGKINAMDFEGMPNPFGVVFDNALMFGDSNPIMVPRNKNIESGTLYFTQRLSKLKGDKELKKALWEQLQEIRQKLV